MESHQLDVRFGPHQVTIPYHQLNGAAAGPHLFISGGMHGGEINGIAVVDAFLTWARETELESRLAGRITVLPVLNPSGFAHMQRRVWEDDVDPNRAFGVAEPATLAEQMALELTERVLRHCGFGIDFHDASGDAALLPHVRVHRDEASGCTKEMGQVFGTELIIERDGSRGMMAIELHRHFDIPVLTVEVGGAQRIFPAFVALGLRGIQNILAASGMTTGEVALPERQFYLNRRFGIKAEAGVMVTFTRGLGEFAHYGDVIGRLYLPQTSEHHDLHAPMCGLLFALHQPSQAPIGATLFSILETDECHVDRTTLGYFEELERVKVKRIKM